jgi:chemotaxis protein histidine kinase CheA
MKRELDGESGAEKPLQDGGELPVKKQRVEEEDTKTVLRPLSGSTEDTRMKETKVTEEEEETKTDDVPIVETEVTEEEEEETKTEDGPIVETEVTAEEEDTKTEDVPIVETEITEEEEETKNEKVPIVDTEVAEKDANEEVSGEANEDEDPEEEEEEEEDPEEEVVHPDEETAEPEEGEAPKEESNDVKEEDEEKARKEESKDGYNTEEVPKEESGETNHEGEEEASKDDSKEEDMEEGDEDPKGESNEEGKQNEDVQKELKGEDKEAGGDEAKEGDGLIATPLDNDADFDERGPNNTMRTSAGRRLTFPEKLMELLNSEDCQESMCWLPNGNAFALHPTLFMKVILPKHFEGTKFESFTRKLNRWGFKRIAGEDAPEDTFAYSHHLFKRDYSELCRGMSGGKKMEQDFSHLIRYRERERLLNAAATNPGSLLASGGNLGYGGMPGAPSLGMQQGLGQQADLQRMLLERQIAAAGGMAANPYGNFGGGGGASSGGGGGGFERELALREMLLRQEAATGQNPNAAFFQQQQFAARFGQAPGAAQMQQMSQMHMSHMAPGAQMMGQGGAPGAPQPAPSAYGAAMMAGAAASAGMANGAAAQGAPMPGAPADPAGQSNNADLMMMQQEQRFRLQQHMAMQGGQAGMNPGFAGAGPYGM